MPTVSKSAMLVMCLVTAVALPSRDLAFFGYDPHPEDVCSLVKLTDQITITYTNSEEKPFMVKHKIWKRLKLKVTSTSTRAALAMGGKILLLLFCTGILFIIIPCVVVGKACPSIDYMYPVKSVEPVKKGSDGSDFKDKIKLGDKGGASGFGSTNQIHVDEDRKTANNNEEVDGTTQTEKTSLVKVPPTVVMNSTETVGDVASSTEASTTSDSPDTHLFPFTVTVYAEPFHNGRSKTIKFENGVECKGLPRVLQRNVHSIDTEGNCVFLCASLDCSEKCMKFAPGTKAHDRVMSLRFHNKAVAARACEPDKAKA